MGTEKLFPSIDWEFWLGLWREVFGLIVVIISVVYYFSGKDVSTSLFMVLLFIYLVSENFEWKT